MQVNHRSVSCTALTTAALLGLTACGGDSAQADGAAGEEQVELSFAYWGGGLRVEQTDAIIDAFEAEHPNITVNGSYGEFGGHWEQLATQTAGGDTPDLIQMDDKYLREYADRGVLLDLTEVDVSKLDEDAANNGRTEDGLFGSRPG